MTKAKQAVFAAAVTYLTAVAAFAQSGAGYTPTISANAFGEWRAGETIEVRTGRELDLERALVAEVAAYLTGQGRTVVASRAEIVLTVTSTAPVPGIAARDALSVDDRLKTLDMRRAERPVQVPYDQRRELPGASVFTVRMSAYRPGQSNLWVGEASAPDTGGGREATSLRLSRTLADTLGKSVTPPPAEPDVQPE